MQLPSAGEEVAGKLSLRVQQLDVAVETKTKVCTPPACQRLMHTPHNPVHALNLRHHRPALPLSLDDAGQCVCHDGGVSSVPSNA
jgi:hypothetical protein